MSDEIKFEIKHFTEFLEKCFGRKVIDYSMEPLTKAGDNYGSVLHAVEVKISGKVVFPQIFILKLKTGVNNKLLF